MIINSVSQTASQSERYSKKSYKLHLLFELFLIIKSIELNALPRNRLFNVASLALCGISSI